MPANSLLAWNNYAKNATLTASSQATNLPASNVAGDSGAPSQGWQSVSGDVSAATLTITPAVGAMTWDVIGVFRTNLTNNAIVTFQLYSGASVVWSTSLMPPVGYGSVIALPPASTMADYVVITFNDSGNPDNLINVPLVFCGNAWRPNGSAGFNSTIGRDVNTSEVTTRGGQEFPTTYYNRKRWNLELVSMKNAETWNYADQLLIYATGNSNVLFIPDVTSAFYQTEAVFGRLKAGADISYPSQAADFRRWQAIITERL